MAGKKIEERLKEDNGVSKEFTLGIPLDGSADPTGEYPRRENWYGNSTSAAGRGVKINTLWTGGSTLGVNFDLSTNHPSMYPFNQANETPSGHSFELDDTPGNERVLIKHNSGSGVELKPDGSVVVSSRSNRIEVVGADHNMVVQGQGNIVYDGDLNLTVNGDYNLTVNGTYNLDVGANENHSVHGTYITEVGDVHQTLVRGNKDVKVYGDVFDFTAGEQKIVTKKDLRLISRKDIISNAKRNVRMTAMDKITGSSGNLMALTSKKTVITGEKGKIGGENFHYIGSLFTGPEDDLGTNTVFHGNLVGRALEAWTAKYALHAEESHSAYRAEVAVTAVSISRAAAMILAKSRPSGITRQPGYEFKWGWNVEGRTAWEQQTDFLEGDDPVSPFYSTNKDWFEVWNKTSPYAVRNVMVDEDDTLEDKLSKIQSYTYYFRWTPNTEEIRSKLRTMDDADDTATAPEKQTDGKKCIESLQQENRVGAKYKSTGPESPYEAKRTGKSSPYDGARFGTTLLGNPVERSSKVVTPTNRDAASRQILTDPLYNPDLLKSMVVGNTKLSKSTTMSKFFGAPGSRTSLDFIPIMETRLALARQYYLHAWLMEGIFGAKEFQNYRLQVTEGYYYPSSGIREAYDGSGEKVWREPFKESGQESVVSGSPYINELKNNGRAVVYSLFNTKGQVDYSATFDLSLYVRDTFFYDQVSLDYDMNRPDDVLSQQLIVVMPEVDKDFKANFEMKTCTYFNRSMLDPNDLVEVSD